MVTAVQRQAEPMMEMNTTPLIDVMLVLIIMLIITMPMQEHAVKIDLPSGPPLPLQPDPVRNKIMIYEDGSTAWNGTRVSAPELSRLLTSAAAMTPQPELQLQPLAMAPYVSVDEVLVATKRSGIEKLGFTGNEAYRNF